MTPMGERAMGNLDEVLDNLGVFRAAARELVQFCPSGFRRIPISQGPDFYLSLQALDGGQVAYAHTHPDSEEWTVVLDGKGEAMIHEAIPLEAGSVVGRAAAHPHGFRAGPDPFLMLSIQIPRPAEGGTTWDEAGTTSEPIHCVAGGRCRRCARCGGHSAELTHDRFECENCGNVF
jgi:quercetin dioxygenase-like cupin family protein